MDETVPERLKRVVFERLEQCRQQLPGGTVDMLGVQQGVRAYCDALAALPRSEAAGHNAALQQMMRELGDMGKALAAERDAVRAQLDGLGRLRQANVAYQTSDTIGKKHVKKESE